MEKKVINFDLRNTHINASIILADVKVKVFVFHTQMSAFW